MSTKYRVWVKQGQDLQHASGYHNVAEFEYIDGNDDYDLLVAETIMPVTLERLLNTDSAVVRYAELTEAE